MLVPQQVEVPEWYTAGQMPPSRDMSSFERDMAALQLQREAASENGGDPAHAPPQPPCLEHWDVISGGDCLADCSDTVSRPVTYALTALPSKFAHHLVHLRAA